MNKKILTTILLSIILLLTTSTGFVYTSIIQQNEITEKQKYLNNLEMRQLNPDDLIASLQNLKERSIELDKIISNRKYVIPTKLEQSDFYRFIDKVSRRFYSDSYVDIEYELIENENKFKYYLYNLAGTLYFSDLYKLIYSIEQSKEFKKIFSLKASDFVSIKENGYPAFMVNVSLKVGAYFSEDERFSNLEYDENSLYASSIYNFFFPLVRNKIPPNDENLPDVQNANLLALVPEGAFISDGKGQTFMLKEGSQVYLGYLTSINFEKQEVKFILNKGGIIEEIVISMGDTGGRKS